MATHQEDAMERGWDAELGNGSYVRSEDYELVELIIISVKISGWSSINRYEDTEKLHRVCRGRHISEMSQGAIQAGRYSHSMWLNPLNMEKYQTKIMLKDKEW